MAVNTFTGATDSNWGTATNWSLGSVPTAVDGNVATFSVASPACTVNTSNRVCNTLDMSGYTNTLTMSNNISVSGDITLPSGAATITGSGTLTLAATGRTITPNGFTWPNPFSTTTTVGAITLAANFRVDGLFTFAIAGSNTTTVSGFKLTLGSSFALAAGGTVAGTTNIEMVGTGTISGASTLRNNFTINTAGTITFSGAIFTYNTGTFTYTAGTVVASSTTLSNGGIAATYDVAGISWGGITLNGAVTTTLSSNINNAGTLTLGSTTAATVINGFAINHSGSSFVQNATTGNTSGTTVLNITGTCAITAPALTTGRTSLPTIFAATSVITMTTAVSMAVGKLVNLSPNVTTTSAWVSGGGGALNRIMTGM